MSSTHVRGRRRSLGLYVRRGRPCLHSLSRRGFTEVVVPVLLLSSLDIVVLVRMLPQLGVRVQLVSTMINTCDFICWRRNKRSDGN